MGKDLTIQSTFGQVLRQLRTHAGISQERLGLESNLDRTYISLLERGLRQPSLTTLFQIGSILEAKPSRMLEMVEERLKGTRTGKS